MKARLCLAVIATAMLLGPAAFAQAGSTNGSGSGFLNTDIMVGTGGSRGPAELNPFLYGTAWSFPAYYRAGFYPPARGFVTGRVLTNSAVFPSCGPCGPAILPAAEECGPCGRRITNGFDSFIY